MYTYAVKFMINFRKSGLRSFGSLTITSLLMLTACATAPQIDPRATPEMATERQTKPLTRTKNAMISAANPLAVRAGLRILKEGGSAVDAAITAQMMLNLVEPQSSGIGGGGFMLIFDSKTGQLTTIDGRETAPMSVQEDLFLHQDGKRYGFFEAAVGGRAVGTPGLLALLHKAHQKHGQRPWGDLFTETIQTAEDGFKISPRLHQLVKNDKHLKNDPVARSYFYDTEGNAHPIGFRLQNTAFAQTLKDIQKNGPDTLYKGALGAAIVKKVRSHKTNPGFLDQNDLSSYQAKGRDPVCLLYRTTYKVCGMPPPSSGGITVLEILGLMEQYDQNNDPKPEIDRTHLQLEASKLAFADRNHFIGDDDFVPVPTQQLLSTSYLIGRQTLIQHDSALSTPVAPGGPALYSQNWAPHATDHGVSTTHLSVVDQNGMVVSMTTSIENAFGSRQMVGGFLLNNQLTDFSFYPAKNGVPIANRVEPGKRPRSSMAPIIVLDAKTNKPVLAIGSPGGSRIIGYVAQSLINILDHKMPLNEALSKGHITNRNGKSDLEKGTEAALLQNKLEKLGHNVKLSDMTSGLHAVQILDDGTLLGAADPRREGVALGY